MPRFILSNVIELSGIITGEEAHHIIKVHRHKIGDTLEVSHNREVFRARITDVVNGDISLELLERLKSPEPNIEVTLYQGLVKGDKLETIIQKSVEIGVSRVVPVECNRSIVSLDPRKARERTERWQRISGEASKQSGRAVVPEVHPPVKLAQALSADQAKLKLLAYEGGGLSLKQLLMANRGITSVSLLVGPEGGFTLDEVEEARRNGFTPVTLGPRILRAETAPLSLLSIVLYELSDMGG